MDRDEITADVAARLVAGQFPQWAHLPVVPVEINGWDNTTFRLGDELSVRLPNSEAAAAQVRKEHRWLPFLAGRLPVPIPEPAAMGRPSEDFPRPWSVYRWLPGETASADRVPDPVGFAVGLAGFLTALHGVDTSGGPPAGAHNFFRGAPLATYDKQTRDLIRERAGDIDADAATEVWDTAVASAWERAPVWLHGDFTGSNLLVDDGKLRAVIDFGGVAVGDPACDLVMEWVFFSGESAMAFRRGLPHLDEATWARGRGWALWKALLVMAEDNDPSRRFGWGPSPRQIVDIVIADHARTAGR